MNKNNLHATMIQEAEPDQQQWRQKLATLLESKKSHTIALILLLADLTLTTLELTSSLLSCDNGSEKRQEAKSRETTAPLHWAGMAILSLLLGRTALLAAALGAVRAGLVVDAVVLTGALVMEGLLEGRGGGLLAVASLWRVVRVVETAFELGGDQPQTLQALREQNAELARAVDQKEELIRKLVEDLDARNDLV